MSDIFSTNIQPAYGGSFAMDEAVLTFSGLPGGDGGLGFLIQSVSVQYTRPVQRIFELGPRKVTYYVAGRPEGRMQIQRLAAPAPVQSSFLTQFSNICNVPNNTFSITTRPGTLCTGINAIVSQDSTVDSRYTFKYCIIDNVAFTMSVGQMAMTENISLMFAAMSIDDGNTGQAQR